MFYYIADKTLLLYTKPFFSVGSLNASCCQTTAMERSNGKTIWYVIRCLVILYLTVHSFSNFMKVDVIYLHKAIPYYPQ